MAESSELPSPLPTTSSAPLTTTTPVELRPEITVTTSSSSSDSHRPQRSRFDLPFRRKSGSKNQDLLSVPTTSTSLVQNEEREKIKALIEIEQLELLRAHREDSTFMMGASSPGDDRVMRMRILILRILLLIMLCLLAALLGYFMYEVVRDAEVLQAETAFNSAAQQLRNGLLLNLQSKVSAATSTASYFKFGLPQNSSYAVVPGFEVFSSQILPLTFTRALSINPLITPDTRAAFEAYGVAHVAELGGSPALVPQMQRGMFYKSNGLNVAYPPNATNPVFFPVWQIAPIASNEAVIMYDLYSEANRNAAIRTVMATGLPATTDIIQLVQDTAIGIQRASGIVFTSITSKSANASLIGIASAVFSWDDILVHSLPPSQVSAWLVLNSPERHFTFYFDNGVVTNIGNGDSTADHVPAYLLSKKQSVTVTVGVRWTVDIYPAEQMWSSFLSNIPRNICIAIVAAIVAVALVFIFYDYLASGRFEGLTRFANAATRVLEELRVVPKPHTFEVETEQMRLLNEKAGFADMEVKVPTELERRLVRCDELLGAGAFGQVFKGALSDRPNGLTSVVAIKSFPRAAEANYNEIFMEAMIMNQLDHPNIVKLRGVITRDQPILLVLEYCEHGSLEKVLREHKNLFTSSRILMAHDVANGMIALHEKGLVHRDLAARNVLVDSRFRCKICDFGHARRVQDDTYYQATTLRIAIRWVAIEALSNKRFSERSDVWSFGVLMWEIWSGGQVPYDPWSNEKVWMEVSNGYRLPCPEGCPPHLYTIMRQCWVEDPHNRPLFPALRDMFGRMLNGDTLALQRNMEANLESKSVEPSHRLTVDSIVTSTDQTFTNSASHYIFEDSAFDSADMSHNNGDHSATQRSKITFSPELETVVAAHSETTSTASSAHHHHHGQTSTAGLPSSSDNTTLHLNRRLSDLSHSSKTTIMPNPTNAIVSTSLRTSNTCSTTGSDVASVAIAVDNDDDDVGGEDKSEAGSGISTAATNWESTATNWESTV